MIKKISELNNVLEDGDYVVQFDNAEIAKSFSVEYDSIHVANVINGEMKLKIFDPAIYEEIEQAEMATTEEITQKETIEVNQDAVNIGSQKIEQITSVKPKKTLFDKVFGKIKQ